MPELRRELSEEEEREHRGAGGRIAQMVLGAGVIECATVRVAGMRRQYAVLYVEDCAHVSVDLESGRVRCEFKAKALWAGNWRDVVESWLGGLLEYFTGHSCTIDEAFDLGWQCTRLELCCDFVDFSLVAEDRGHFSTRSKVSVLDKSKIIDHDSEAEDEDEDEDARIELDGEVETIQVGSRANNVSLISYCKTTQVNTQKRGANSCNYAAAWQYGGVWKGSVDSAGLLVGPKIRRVEIRLKDRGLELIERKEEAGTVAEEYNLRDPAKVIDAQTLASAWTWATTRCARLVDPYDTRTGERVTRLCRAPTDDRWLAVQSAARMEWKGSITSELKQSRRQAQDIHEERKRRSERRLCAALEEYAAQHGVRADTPAARSLILEFARYRGATKQGLAPTEHGRRYRARFANAFGPDVADSRGELMEFLRGQGSELMRGMNLDELVGVVVQSLEGGGFGELTFDLVEIERLDPPRSKPPPEPDEDE